MHPIIEEIRAYLRAHADEALRDGAERFFKEPIQTYGFRTAEVEKLARRQFNALNSAPKAEVFALCEELWRSGFMEESFIACHWAYALRRQYEPADFAVFERWVNDYISNWAACDTLCNHAVGALLEMFPACVVDLRRWAVSPNRWMRRASAVSLIVPARKGLFLKDIFALAHILLRDDDDLVQKGYGWMLKAASQAHEEAVFRFVLERRAAMPRVALRYAIEKMTPERRAEAMRKP